MFVLETRSLLVVFFFLVCGGGVMDMDICAFMQVFWNHACNIS